MDPIDDPATQLLRALARHLESQHLIRTPAGPIVQALRFNRDTAAAAMDELVELGHIRVHNPKRLTAGPLANIVELTPEGRHEALQLETRELNSRPGDPLQDTWTSRDLPVLREAARLLDSATGWARFSQLADATRLSLAEVEAAVSALESDGYITARRVWPREASRVGSLSAEARRQVGLWPTPESALDRMIAALEAIAANVDEDEDTRSRARKILDGLTGAGREVGIAVVGAAISGQIPGV
jgi:DNA-binding Lrp family transcriptional regulator